MKPIALPSVALVALAMVSSRAPAHGQAVVQFGSDDGRYNLAVPDSYNYAPGVSALQVDPPNYAPDHVQIMSDSQGLCCGSTVGGQAGVGLGGLGDFGIDLSQQDPEGVWLITIAARPENTYSGVPEGGDFPGMTIGVEMFDADFERMSAWVGDLSGVGTTPTVVQLEGNLATPSYSNATCCEGVALDINSDTADVIQITPTWPYGPLGEIFAYDIYEIRLDSGGLPGDVNGDGMVTRTDFEIISGNLSNSPVVREEGDLNRNQEVELLDFRQWKHNVEPAAAGAAANVPEPNAILLAAVAGILLLVSWFGRPERIALRQPGRVAVDAGARR